MTSLQYQSSPQTIARLAGSEPTFWRHFADTGLSYFKWTYGGTFLVSIAYYVFRLFQSLWSSGNFAGFGGAFALFAVAIYGAYRLWRGWRSRVSAAAYPKQTN